MKANQIETSDLEGLPERIAHMVDGRQNSNHSFKELLTIFLLHTFGGTLDTAHRKIMRRYPELLNLRKADGTPKTIMENFL